MIRSNEEIGDLVPQLTQLGAIGVNFMKCLEAHGGTFYDVNGLLEEIAREGSRGHMLHQMVQALLPLWKYQHITDICLTEEDYELSGKMFREKFSHPSVTGGRGCFNTKSAYPGDGPWMYILQQVPANRNLTIAQLRIDAEFRHNGVWEFANRRELFAFSKLVGGVNFGSLEVIALDGNCQREVDDSAVIRSALEQDRTYALEKEFLFHGPSESTRISRSCLFLMRTRNHNPQ